VDVNSKKNSKELEAQFPETRKTIPFRNHLMNRPIRILAVGSSLREGSYSTLAARMALDLSMNYGAVTNFLDLRHTKLPIYDPDDSSQNIQEVRHPVRGSNPNHT
jgi:hypothetical protein